MKMLYLRNYFDFFFPMKYVINHFVEIYLLQEKDITFKMY